MAVVKNSGGCYDSLKPEIDDANLQNQDFSAFIDIGTDVLNFKYRNIGGAIVKVPIEPNPVPSVIPITIQLTPQVLAANSVPPSGDVPAVLTWNNKLPTLDFTTNKVVYFSCPVPDEYDNTYPIRLDLWFYAVNFDTIVEFTTTMILNGETRSIVDSYIFPNPGRAFQSVDSIGSVLANQPFKLSFDFGTGFATQGDILSFAVLKTNLAGEISKVLGMNLNFFTLI